MEQENVTIKQGMSGGWVAFIVIVVLIGGIALGYWYANKNKTKEEAVITPTPTISITASKSASASPTPSASKDWKDFSNDEYGFSLRLTDNWQNYQWQEENPNDGTATKWFRFYIPTNDSNYASGEMPGYANPFVISVYTKAQWNALDKSGPHDTYIAENDNYVIAFSSWQACPTDLCDVITSAEMKKIKDSIVAQ